MSKPSPGFALGMESDEGIHNSRVGGEEKEKTDPLPGWAIALIVVACVAFLVMIIAAVFHKQGKFSSSGVFFNKKMFANVTLSK